MPVNISGKGCIDVRYLITKTIKLYLEGLAWDTVYANRHLDVRVTSNSEVVYFENPRLKSIYL
ncbi:MAG: hypothetical protein AB8Y71_02260 [Coxiella endosymbiont of Haemaphysalis qinghaiensis]